MREAVAVIPAKNEAATIRDVVCAAISVCPVFVVSDHSQDATVSIASDAGAHILELSESTGYGAALVAGIRAALVQGYAKVITLDADGAHDPRDIGPILHAHTSRAADLTLGDRFSSSSVDTVPSAKYWANHLAISVVNKLLGTTLRDVACGFRVIDERLAAAICRSDTLQGFGFAFQILQTATSIGARIASCPVAVRYGAAELHATSQRELLDALLAVMSRLSPDSPAMRAFQLMARLVSDMAPLSVSVGGAFLCLHPVDSFYVFQRHPHDLPNPQFGTVLDLDAAMN